MQIRALAYFPKKMSFDKLSLPLTNSVVNIKDFQIVL